MMPFDTKALLDREITGAHSTVTIPIPEGDYPGVCNADKLEIREVTSKKNGETYFFFETSWDIDSEEVRQITGRDVNRVRLSISLDFADDGTLKAGEGENVALGRMRAACDLNDPNRPFTFREFGGQVATVRVKHRVNEQTGDIMAEASRVSKPE